MSLLLIPILPHTPAEVKVSSENGPPNCYVGGIDFLLERVLNTLLILLTQTATLPFALFLEIRQNLGAC